VPGRNNLTKEEAGPIIERCTRHPLITSVVREKDGPKGIETKHQGEAGGGRPGKPGKTGMKKVWEKKKRGASFYLIRLPFFVILTVVNVFLLSWFGHLLYGVFSDSSTMSLVEWVEHVSHWISVTIGRFLG
jgi:hypothetical protein